VITTLSTLLPEREGKEREGKRESEKEGKRERGKERKREKKWKK
jgi:hypothetical protein